MPFKRIFEPHQRDKDLHAALKAEASGIIRWMVEGYRLNRKEGLEPTPVMEAYLDEYKTNSDPVCQFVQSCVKETNTEGFIPVQEMLATVKTYCNRQGLAAHALEIPTSSQSVYLPAQQYHSV